MEYISVPIIVICSYIVGEIYKEIFKKEQDKYKLIPLVTSIFGGLLGMFIYLTNKEIILDANNIWYALLIGITSGSSATGTNQIIKQLYKK